MNNTILYVLTVLIWGSTWYAIKFQLGDVHPLLSVAYRFALASFCIYVYLKFKHRGKLFNFSLTQHFYIGLLGLSLFCINYWLNYVGTGYLPSGLVSILFSTIIIFNIFNQRLFFQKKIRKNVIIGSIIGLTGLFLIFWPEIEKTHLSNTTLTGIGIILSASYIASLGNMIAVKNTALNIRVIEGNCIGMFYGALFSFILAIFNGAPLTFSFAPSYIASLLYLSVFGSAVAFGTYLTLVKKIGADKASYAAILLPVIALLISTLLENYIWTPLSLGGVILALSGNFISMQKKAA